MQRRRQRKADIDLEKDRERLSRGKTWKRQR